MKNAPPPLKSPVELMDADAEVTALLERWLEAGESPGALIEAMARIISEIQRAAIKAN